MTTIEIDDEVMRALKKKAEPFVDTPNSVLRRLLGLDGLPVGSRRTSSSRQSRRKSSRGAFGLSGKQRRAERAPTGTILPEEEYVRPMLNVLCERGGRAAAREVIDEVGSRLADRLTALDKEPVSSGGVRWQNRMQFARLRMLERGLLKKDSPRGTWEITDRGREHACPDPAVGAIPEQLTRTKNDN